MQYSMPFIDKKKTGQQIRRLMRKRGLSVKDVTEKLMIGSVQCVYHWFSGRRLPSVDNLYALDQMLVYIPQLTEMKKKYDKMRARLPKQRKRNDSYLRTSNLVEYTHANYQIEDAEKDYREVATALAKAQTALDVVNNTEKFEIDLL